MSKITIQSLVEGGKATPGPPLGPALGPLGVNAKAVVDEINKKTKDFEGLRVPVSVIVDPATKKFEIIVGTPPVSALIIKEIGVEKGAKGEAKVRGKETIGNISIDQVVKIAKMKEDVLLSRGLKASAKEILGTCVSMGVTCDGKSPREIIKAIDAGEYDKVLKA